MVYRQGSEHSIRLLRSLSVVNWSPIQVSNVNFDLFINLMVRSTGVGVSISYNSSHRGQLDTGVDVSILLFTRLTEKQFLRTDIACGYCSHTLSSSNPLLLHLLSNLQYLLPSCPSAPLSSTSSPPHFPLFSITSSSDFPSSISCLKNSSNLSVGFVSHHF